MSEILMAQIVDFATGNSSIQPLTTDELNEVLAIKADEEARQKEQDAKAAYRLSALAKLAALGLTQEEVEAL